MKLRYYLRGLGIGILVTALIMGLSGRKQIPLTDAEIKAKASMLGMVESNSLTLSDVQQLQNRQSEAVEEPETGEGPERIEESEPEDEPGTMEETENQGSEPGISEPGTIASGAIEAGNDEAKTPENESAGAMGQEAATSDCRTITVKSGSGSLTVCRQLEGVGLVEDAEDFDRFLVKNGYATRISVGTFEIREGSSWEEIAALITGGNR